MKTVENSYALASSVRDLNCRGIHLRWSFSLSLFDQRGSSAESRLYYFVDSGGMTVITFSHGSESAHSFNILGQIQGSVPEFGIHSYLHPSTIAFIDLLHSTSQPLQFTTDWYEFGFWRGNGSVTAGE